MSWASLSRFWGRTPGLARAAFIVPAAFGLYFACIFIAGIAASAATGGGSPPPGHTNPPAVLTIAIGVVSLAVTLAMVLAPFALIGFGLRSDEAGFRWAATAFAAAVALGGLGFGASVALSTDFFEHDPGQSGLGAFVGEAGAEPFVWVPMVLLGFAYVPIAWLGVRAARSAGRTGGNRPVAS